MTQEQPQSKENCTESETWLSSTQVGKAVGYSFVSVLYWARTGVIPQEMFERSPGGHYRFRPEVVEHIRTYHDQQKAI